MVTTDSIIKSQAKDSLKPKKLGIVTALGPDDPDDGDIGRQQRGIAIAAITPLKETKVGYSVPSQSGNGSYIVRFDDADNPACSCPDFALRDARCKHIYAVELALMREDNPAQSPDWAGKAKKAETVKKPTYPQDWPRYNQYQVNEEEVAKKLLRTLCDSIEQPAQGRGRPKMPLGDMVFAVTAKVFSTMSVRRSMTGMRNATDNGHLDKTPSITSMFRYLENPAVTPILQKLIEDSAGPLRGLEEDFAVDSSGFSTSVFDRHFDFKWGTKGKRKQPHRQAKFITAHIACGVRSNIVTAAIVRTDRSHDSVHLPELLRRTAGNFSIRNFLGDLGYLSTKNFEEIVAAGATPRIPFKRNSKARQSQKKPGPGADLWERLYHEFSLQREAWLNEYRPRSNVETCFSMAKLKFGGFVRSKTEVAQINEVYAKLLCHNLSVLVRIMYTLGITPTWDSGEERDSPQLVT